MSEITLTKDEKDCLKPAVEAKAIAEVAFYKASEMCRNAQNAFAEKLHEMWPNVVTLKHPPDKEWTVIVCDNPLKEPLDKDKRK